MSRVHREAIVAYSPAQMFALVNDVESYPAFLPGCAAASILELGEQSMRARLSLSKSAFKQSFVTRNTWINGESIDMQLVEGPFKYLRGRWQFQPLGDGCKISVTIEFEFLSLLGGLAFGSAFQKLLGSLMDAFIQRAKVTYGS